MKKALLIGAGILGLYLLTSGKKKTVTNSSGSNIDKYNNKSFQVNETGQAFITKNNERYYNAYTTGWEAWIKNFSPSANLGLVNLSDVKHLPIVGHVNQKGEFIKDGLYFDPIK